jgi:hypothetical protein
LAHKVVFLLKQLDFNTLRFRQMIPSGASFAGLCEIGVALEFAEACFERIAIGSG